MTLFLLFLFVFIVTRNKSYSATFIGLAATYFFLFYVYPLVWLLDKRSFYYVGFYQNLSFDMIFFTAAAGVLFVFGFFVPDVLFFLKKRKKNIFDDVFLKKQEVVFVKCNKVFWFLLFFVVIYYSYGFLDFNRAAAGYAVRRSDVEGSWLLLLVGILAKSLFYAVLFFFFYLKKRRLAILMLLIMLVYLLTGSTGRANLVFNIVLLFLAIFNLQARNLVVISVFGVFLLLPVLLSMKHIIYSISVESRLPDLYEIYFGELKFETVLSNFGHPLVSLMKVDGLIDIVGYRYFYDYLQGFLFYMRAFGLNVGDSLIYFNTENLIGRRQSIIPTGYLAFGYVQLGYIGVVFSGIFYRMIGYIAEYVYYKVNVRHQAVKFYFCYAAAASFYHGEIRVMVMTFFIPMFVVLFFRPERLMKGHV